MENQIQTQNSGGNLVPLSEIKQAAEWVAKSGLFGITSSEQAATLMLVAQAEGSHFMTAMREFHVIDGKPSIKADAALARFQKSGGRVQWLVRTDTQCKAIFSHPQGGELEVEWTFEKAEKAGFTWAYEKVWDASKNKMVFKYDNGKKVKQTKDNWLRTPRQMLAARVVSEGVRAVFAACLNGFYTTEEASDFEHPKSEAKTEAKAANAPQNVPVQEAEIVPDAPPEPPPPDEPPPDFTVNINGGGSAAPRKAAPLSPSEANALCEWLSSLPDRNKTMQIVGKYCDPRMVKTLSRPQTEKLIAELTNVFGITYTPSIFEEA